MTKIPVLEPTRTVFFECDCFDKNDLIRAEYSEFKLDSKDGNFHIDRDLNITFSTQLADYNSVWDYGIIAWCKKIWWRIRNACRILFTGVIRTEGYFQPARSYVDTKNNKIERLFGYENTKNFAKWLDTMADKIKKDYEEDEKNYTIMQMQKELDEDDKIIGVTTEDV